MKHVIAKGSKWKWEDEPFPAYRCHLDFGRHKQAHGLFPVQGLEPVAGVLPDDCFKVVRTAKGTIVAVAGSDQTGRCLLMARAEGGRRGGCALHDKTTATIVVKAAASNAIESAVEVVAILAPGQRVVFRRWYCVQAFHEYTWNGEEVIFREYTKAEWSYQNEGSEGSEGVETL